MSIEQNKKFVYRWFELINQENWEDHFAELTAFFNTPEEGKAYLEEQREFRKAFADYHFTIDKVVAEGNDVAIFGTVQATHTAEFPYWELKGIAPTGKQLEWGEVHLIAIVDEKWDVSNYRFLLDGVGRLMQMGVLPKPD